MIIRRPSFVPQLGPAQPQRIRHHLSDAVVARTWGQPGWADYSGVSRTLTALSSAETQQIVLALERVSQPLLDQEVVLAWTTGRLELDADLSPRPVSDTSRTYPGAAFGHVSDPSAWAIRRRSSP